MLPIIAIVGRPNVGKSTLFNKLTHTRDAIVADHSGLTRDRIYGEGKVGMQPYILIDTGGLVDDKGGLSELVTQNSMLAAREADSIIFMVDGREGLVPQDEVIADQLRLLNRPIQVAVNKTDGLHAEAVSLEFFALGLGTPMAISTSHSRGLTTLINTVLTTLPQQPVTDTEAIPLTGPCVAVLGRPNVGKSTLVNRLLGEERVIVYDQPGTTRDSIVIPFSRDSKPYTLIDTAGVRRRARVSEVIEKFSIIKTLQAIEKANVVIVVMDATESITEQDATLLGMVMDSGRSVIIAVNKWDGLEIDQKNYIKYEVERRLHFIDYARIHFISALHGSGVGNLFTSIDKAYSSAFVEVATATLSRLLEKAVYENPPPMVMGRRIKLRFAHLSKQNPPTVVIHGNQTESVPNSYTRYLEKYFRAGLRLEGTPIRIEYKTSENPFAGRKNTLTVRQYAKRKRLLEHVKR